MRMRAACPLVCIVLTCVLVGCNKGDAEAEKACEAKIDRLIAMLDEDPKTIPAASKKRDDQMQLLDEIEAAKAKGARCAPEKMKSWTKRHAALTEKKEAEFKAQMKKMEETEETEEKAR